MRIFKTSLFAKWARKQRLSDEHLAEAVNEMEQGLFDAMLGNHIYKKRVALCGRGKRAGARTILVFQTGEKAFFIYGYAKNKKSDISAEELEITKKFATELLGYHEIQLKRLIAREKLFEVNYEKQNSD